MSLINDALKRARHHQTSSTTPTGDAAAPAPPPLQPVEDRSEPSRQWLVLLPVLLLSLGASLWFFWQWKNPAAAADPAPTTKTNVLVVATTTLAKWQARQDDPEPTNDPQSKSPSNERTVGPATRPPHPTPSAGNRLAPAPADSAPSAPIPAQALPKIAPAPQLASTAPASGPVSQPSAVLSGSALAPAAVPPLSTALAAPSAIPAAPPRELKLQGIFYRLKHPTALIDGRVVSIGDEIEGYHVARIDRGTVKLIAAGQTNTLTLR